ncbi:hypothetical protein LCGC14_0832290 [marine sediment metagenome]|uniref:Uncharacterized protein n=1 Tax=marine sediment metagenome TaxID=412755 RepID=A0A0F9PFJ9_9ZZZZ
MTMVELPAVYIDDVQMLEPGGLALLNRDPDDGQVRVPEDLNIVVDIADLTGIGIDTSATQVFVAGILAFDGGVFQPGFAGSTSSPDSDTLRIDINPASDFASEQAVTVRVVSETTGGANTIDETYSFTIIDLIPPAFASAVPQSLRVVRFTFDDPVKQTDPNDLLDALNHDAYLFTPLTFPAVTPVGVSVVSVDERTVDVTVSIDLSPGQTYQVRAPNFTDPTAQPPPPIFIPPEEGGG